MPNKADIERQEAVMAQTVAAIIPRLAELVELLADPPVKPPVQTTAGVLDPPFGPTRYSTVQLRVQCSTVQKHHIACIVQENTYLPEILVK